MTTRFPSRRWALVLGACLLVGAVFVCLPRPGPVERLRPYLGRDLRTLSEDEQLTFDRLVGRLSPDAQVLNYPCRPQTWNPRDWYGYSTARPTRQRRQCCGMGEPFVYLFDSWYMWRVRDARQRERLVLFQGVPALVPDGSSTVTIFVFDRAGKLLTECDFSTGPRVSINDACWVEYSDHGFPCLRISAAPGANAADIASLYYAFTGDAFALVRLEDRTGGFVPVSPKHIGPPLPERTPKQWEAALRSPDRAEVLRALVWAGQRDSDALRETHARAGVRSAVEDFTHSEDNWVREAARHAQEAIRRRKEPVLQYRVTKYDPALRDASGRYTRDEWTAFGDIGRSFGGEALTREEYQRTEDAYVATALAFLRRAGVTALTIRGLEKARGVPLAFEEGSVLSPAQAGEVIRRVLREEFWCRLEAPGAYVHIGWDYYMYLGVPRACPEAEHLAQWLGLFVEPLRSPYLEQESAP